MTYHMSYMGLVLSMFRMWSFLVYSLLKHIFEVCVMFVYISGGWISSNHQLVSRFSITG